MIEGCFQWNMAKNLLHHSTSSTHENGTEDELSALAPFPREQPLKDRFWTKGADFFFFF